MAVIARAIVIARSIIVAIFEHCWEIDHCCKSDAIVIARARRVRKRRGGREPIGRSDVELHCIGRGRRRVRRGAENGEAQTEGRELWPTIARPGVRTLGPYPDHAAVVLGGDVEAGHSPWQLAAQLPIKWPFSANGQTGSMSEAGESRHAARKGVGGF